MTPLPPELLYPSFVTALVLLIYWVLTLNVGRSRFQHGIKPPAMAGNENFERVLRVQQNTLEQLVFFLPLLWLFSLYVDARWGAGLGLVWALGRILYAWGYYQAPEKRGPGFGLSALSSLALLFGSLGVLGWRLWQQIF